MSCRIKFLELSSIEIEKIDSLLAEIFDKSSSIEIQPFLNSATVLAHSLPLQIRKVFYEFKLYQSSEILIVKNYKVDRSLIGNTPSKHRLPGQIEMLNRYEVLHVLFSTLLGEPFSWTTIQNGYIINDVMPVYEHSKLIASSGSESYFDLHTEDAFHECAGDYLGLMCLRNPSNVDTIFSGITKNDLTEEMLSILFEPRFVVGANIAQDVPKIEHFSPILFGNPQFPYIRVNLNLTEATSEDIKAENALKLLKNLLRKNSLKINLQAGDFCYIDNYKVVHGRVPFVPSYDGTDRWLKRLYISSCFRNSVRFRNKPNDRILKP